MQEGSQARRDRDTRDSLAEITRGIAALTTAQTAPRPHNAVNDFTRSVKRNIADYPEFKNDKQWDQWARAVESLALTHDIEILESAYVEPTAAMVDEKALHDLKSQWIYSMFVQKVTTTKGAQIVRAREDTKNGYAVWGELKDWYVSSTKASSRSDNLRTLIVTERIPSVPKKQLVDYLTQFEDHVREYNSMVEGARIIDDSLYVTYLEAFVSQHAQLAQVKNTLNAWNAIQPRPLADDRYRQQYKKLLEDQAATLDTQYQQRRAGGRRSTNMTESLYETLYDVDDDDRNSDTEEDEYEMQFHRTVNSHVTSGSSDSGDSHYFDANDELDDVQVYVTKRDIMYYAMQLKQSKKYRIDWDTWKHLSKEAKDMWVHLEEKDKELILSFGFSIGERLTKGKSSQPKTAPKGSPSKGSKTTQKKSPVKKTNNKTKTTTSTKGGTTNKAKAVTPGQNKQVQFADTDIPITSVEMEAILAHLHEFDD